MAPRTKKTPAPQTPDAQPEGEMRLAFEPLSELLKRRAPRNPKKHNHKELSGGMSRFGYTIPVMVDEGTDRVVAGHGRLETLEMRKAAGEPAPTRVRVREDGEWLVPVLRGIAFPNAEEAEAYLLSDNRHTERGGYDDELLAEMLGDVRARDGSLDGLGWSEDDASDLIASIKHDEPESQGSGARDRLPPDDFASHDANTKETVHCPKCGFPVVTNA